METKPYDPWNDYNDDGKIDAKDFVNIISLMMSQGTPVNKTALLYNVNATFTQLLAKINNLNVSLHDLEAYLTTRIVSLETIIAEQQSKILELENKTAELETQIAILNATKLGKPDWQQEVTIPKGEHATCYHYLGTTNVFVYMVGYDYDGYDYHQIAYGGDSTLGGSYGAWWSGLTTTEIEIYRLSNDERWDRIHILIWKIPLP